MHCKVYVRVVASSFREVTSDISLQICLIVFTFGDARQLFPYELARPQLPEIRSTDGASEESPKTHWKGAPSAYIQDPDMDIEAYAGDPKAGLCSPLFSKRSGLASNASSPRVDRIIFPSKLASPLVPPKPLISASRQPSDFQSSASITIFDFDSMPNRYKSDTVSEASDVPVWAPLTRVLSPIVTRTQWDVVVRSIMLSLFITVWVELLLMAVPSSVRVR